MPANRRIIPPPPASWSRWEDLMAEALAEARLAADACEVPVGAVVVSRQGEILGRGRNAPAAAHDPTAHAEVAALRAAASRTGNYRLEGTVLLVTLEPCLMCVGALAHARVAGLVYGAPDAKAGAVDSCLEGLDLPFLNHSVWRMGGTCEAECAALLRAFFAERR